MAEIRPFRALRFDPARVDVALTIAPPYDIISPHEQRALYERSPYNIVRAEYGEQRPGDDDTENRYARAAADLRSWRADGVLTADPAPALYAYRQEFTWGGTRHARRAVFVALRLEEWEKGVVKPHEHTLANPKADRLRLLRATRTQISPVYSIVRGAGPLPVAEGDLLCDIEADGQRHVVFAITDTRALDALATYAASAGVYIADGHHRYETALAYRAEARAAAGDWTGEEPENFVLMALTDAADPGLLVLPTHRVVAQAPPAGDLGRLASHFRVEQVAAADAAARLAAALPETAFVMATAAGTHLLTLTGRTGIEAMMPADQPAAWKRLDVSVLQYGILAPLFGIDDAALSAGALTYTQDAAAALDDVASGHAGAAFLLNATPVAQVLDVADAGGRMPQKSTYFYPKLPTGLLLRPLE